MIGALLATGLALIATGVVVLGLLWLCERIERWSESNPPDPNE